MITEDVKHAIKDRVDIVELIGEYIPLKRVGNNYRALCPFHEEKTPSFYVNPDKQFYHCFGCKASGDIFTFIMEYEHLSYVQAVEFLAKRAGITLNLKKADSKESKLYDTLNKASTFFHAYLKNHGKHAIEYLSKRNISNELIEKFKLGLVPSSNIFFDFLKKENISIELAQKAGLIGVKDKRNFVWLYGRIVFPIYDLYNHIVGFGGRTLKDEASKYINTYETELFKKRYILYNLNRAKEYIKDDGVILTEGFFDVIRLYANGYRNAVAPLGTSFTSNHVRLINRFTEKIYIFFDGDEAGRKASLKTARLFLLHGIEPKIVNTPHGEDPDSIGRDKTLIKNLLDNSVEFLNVEFNSFHTLSLNKRKKLIDEYKNILNAINDEVLREVIAGKIKEITNIDFLSILSPLKPYTKILPQTTAEYILGYLLLEDLEGELIPLITDEFFKGIYKNIWNKYKEWRREYLGLSIVNYIESIFNETEQNEIFKIVMSYKKGTEKKKIKRIIKRQVILYLKEKIKMLEESGDIKGIERIIKTINNLKQKEVE